jgi:hypothetical protein
LGGRLRPSQDFAHVAKNHPSVRTQRGIPAIQGIHSERLVGGEKADIGPAVSDMGLKEAILLPGFFQVRPASEMQRLPIPIYALVIYERILDPLQENGL